MSASNHEHFHTSRASRRITLALALVGLTAGSGLADERHWRQPLDGLFNLAANWDPQQVPGEDDAAVFNLGGWPPYTVTFDTGGTFSNAQCRVHTGAVDMVLQGSTYALGEGWSLIVGDSDGDYGVLSLTDGRVEAEGDIPIGNWGGAAGELTLGTDLSMTLTGVMIVGGDGSGVLSVIDNAALEARAMTAAVYPSATGSILVSGDEATVTVAEWLFVGEEGHGELNVESGASVEVADAVLAGYLPGGEGDVTVTGPGSELKIPTGDLIVADWEGGTGSLLIADGGAVSFDAGYVGNSAIGPGDATVTDPDSLLSIADYLDVGTEGAGSLHVLNGAAVELSHLAFGTSAAGTGSGMVSGENSTLTSSIDLNVAHRRLRHVHHRVRRLRGSARDHPHRLVRIRQRRTHRPRSVLHFVEPGGLAHRRRWGHRHPGDLRRRYRRPSSGVPWGTAPAVMARRW